MVGHYPPEVWATRPEAQQLFGLILSDPQGDHAAAVAQQSIEVLLDAHVAGIVRWIGKLKSGNATFSEKSFTRDAGVALHTILFHLLNGAAAGLPPPPPETTADETRRCKPGWATARPAGEKFWQDLSAARTKAKAGDDTKLQALRGRIFEPAKHKNLRPADPAGGAPGAKAADTRALGGKLATATAAAAVATTASPSTRAITEAGACHARTRASVTACTPPASCRLPRGRQTRASRARRCAARGATLVARLYLYLCAVARSPPQ